MARTLSRIIIACFVLLLGIIAGCLISEAPLCLPFFNSYIRPPEPTPVPIEGKERILTPQEAATMSGSFQKEFQLILASSSGSQNR